MKSITHSYDGLISKLLNLSCNNGLVPLCYVQNTRTEVTIECVKHLLKLGADPNVMGINQNINLPLAAALQHGHEDIAVLLLENGVDGTVDPYLYYAITNYKKINKTTIKLLLQKGAKYTDFIPVAKMNLFSYSLNVLPESYVIFILDHCNLANEDFEYVGQLGTPLNSALVLQKYTVLEKLLEMNLCDINGLDNNGLTILYMALVNPKTPKSIIINLLQRGANPHYKVKKMNNMSILEFISLQKNQELIDLINNNYKPK